MYFTLMTDGILGFNQRLSTAVLCMKQWNIKDFRKMVSVLSHIIFVYSERLPGKGEKASLWM